jgi:hypothetical protein
LIIFGDVSITILGDMRILGDDGDLDGRKTRQESERHQERGTSPEEAVVRRR